MLISVPTYQGKSRKYDLGDFSFPYLAIANIIISAAYGGWSYYLTKQQIEQAKRVSGTDIASATDIDAITQQVMAQMGVKTSKSDLSNYIGKLISADPMVSQQLPPSALLEARLAVLEQQQQQQGIPTWGWIALGAVGFLALKQFKTI